MRLIRRIARLEATLGLPRELPAFAPRRAVTDEERATAAERYRTALAAEVADVAARRVVPKFDCSDGPVDPDDQTLELWCLQHCQPRDSERSRILREVLREISNDELTAFDDAIRPLALRAQASHAMAHPAGADAR